MNSAIGPSQDRNPGITWLIGMATIGGALARGRTRISMVVGFGM